MRPIKLTISAFGPYAKETEIILDELGEWGLYMMMANALIFLPMGFFPNLLWRRPKWWKGLLVGFCSSFSIEFLQLFAGRSTDVDDLILNSSGAFLGGLLALLLGKMVPNLTRKFQVEVRYGRETGDTEPAPGAGRPAGVRRAGGCPVRGAHPRQH